MGLTPSQLNEQRIKVHVTKQTLRVTILNNGGDIDIIKLGQEKKKCCLFIFLEGVAVGKVHGSAIIVFLIPNKRLHARLITSCSSAHVANHSSTESIVLLQYIYELLQKHFNKTKVDLNKKE